MVEVVKGITNKDLSNTNHKMIWEGKTTTLEVEGNREEVALKE